jgi:putative DNA primase/helicase
MPAFSLADVAASVARAIAQAPLDKKLAAFRIMIAEAPKWVDRGYVTKPDLVDELRRVALDGCLVEVAVEKALAEAFTKRTRAEDDDEVGEPLGMRKEQRRRKNGPATAEVVLTYQRASDITMKPVRWLWTGRIARGKVTLLAGEPGLAKSQMTLDIAARISNGGCWPVGGSAPRGSVIILSAEDAADDTIVPGLAAAGADLSHIHLLTAVRENGKRRTFNLEADIHRLREKKQELGDLSLCIIDPITSYMGKIDGHRTTDVRAVLEPLAAFAEAEGLAFLALSHPPKAAQAKAINNVTGSLAFVAAARIALLAINEPGTDRHLLLSVKNNLAPLGPGLGYRIAQRTVGPGIVAPYIVWDPTPVHMTADEALAAGRESDGAMHEAREFLADTLMDGPKPATKVNELAAARGISGTTLNRARKAMGVVSAKAGFEGGWELSLPKAAK